MKVNELFEAEKPSVDDSKLCRALNREGVRVTKASMKSDNVDWWMKGKNLVIKTDDWDTLTLSDEKARELGFDGIAGVQEFFKRNNVESSRKPAKTPKIVDRPIYD